MTEVFKDKKHCCKEEGNNLLPISIAERPRNNGLKLHWGIFTFGTSRFLKD